MKHFLLTLTLCAATIACAKHAADAVTDAVVECVIPCDVTAVDAADVGTPTDATATLAGDVTP